MKPEKTSSEIRDEFSHIAHFVYEEKQEAAGLPVAKMQVSLRADMELVAQVDELAERLNMNRQACILKILKTGITDAIGGYIEVFGPEAAHEFWEASEHRLHEFRTKQCEKFNKEGGEV